MLQLPPATPREQHVSFLDIFPLDAGHNAPSRSSSIRRPVDQRCQSSRLRSRRPPELFFLVALQLAGRAWGRAGGILRPYPASRVHKTVGNRSGSGLGWYQTDPNSKFKFEFQKMKNFQKIPKNTSSCDESNGVKFFQIFIHLVYFCEHLKLKKHAYKSIQIYTIRIQRNWN